MLTSCGYHMGANPNLVACRTFSVPYVCGDKDGLFTQELVRQLSLSGVEYVSCHPDYILNVSLVRRAATIGYRRERTYEDDLGKRLVATEERGTYCATFSVVRARCGSIVMGPCTVSESMDYDFQPETSPQNQTRASLGQLDFLKAAGDGAKTPLNRLLAKKIADYVLNAFPEGS